MHLEKDQSDTYSYHEHRALAPAAEHLSDADLFE